jgi:hypothetical protein
VLPCVTMKTTAGNDLIAGKGEQFVHVEYERAVFGHEAM